MSSSNNNSTTMGSTRENFGQTSAKEPTKETEKPLQAEIKKAITVTKSMSSARIYRVAEELRKLNESAYTPHLVSIGPLHSEVKYLKPYMQHVKVTYMVSLLKASIGGEFASMLGECLKEMADSIPDAKQYYAEEVELDEKMLVIDGCFILEVLRRISPINKNPEKKPRAENNESSKPAMPKDQSSSNDPILGIPLTLETVEQDLLLLENQLPFFVLQKLFHCTLGHISNKHSLSDYVLSVFGKRLKIGNHECSNSSNATICACLGDCVLTIDEGNNPPPEKVDCHDHMLHLLYNYYLGDPQPPSKKGPGKSTCMPCSASKEGLSKSLKDMPSASDLAYKGVKFESCNNLLQVEFEILGRCRGACFRIPTLWVDDSTEPILRNLIALEQCCPGFDLHFTSYACLMDRLVDTEKDVEVLGGDRLIHHCLGTNEEASRFFNNLCKGVTLYTECDRYSPTRDLAVYYCERPCYNRFIPATMTHLKGKFRGSPWTSIAFFVAFVSFGISLANFVLSFLR